MPRGSVVACLVGMAAFLAAPAEAAKKPPSATSGEIVAYAMPVLAGGLAAYKRDWHGLAQLTLVTGLTYGTAYGLKQLVRERRPDGTGWDSFPSTTSGLASAPSQFVWHRYGWEWGVPFFLVSKYPGYALDRAKKNRIWDSLGSLAISFTYNELLVPRFKPKQRGVETHIEADADGIFIKGSYRW
jgi:hypothetical protein